MLFCCMNLTSLLSTFLHHFKKYELAILFNPPRTLRKVLFSFFHHWESWKQSENSLFQIILSFLISVEISTLFLHLKIFYWHIGFYFPWRALSLDYLAYLYLIWFANQFWLNSLFLLNRTEGKEKKIFCFWTLSKLPKELTNKEIFQDKIKGNIEIQRHSLIFETVLPWGYLPTRKFLF